MEKLTSVNFCHISTIREEKQSTNEDKLRLHNFKSGALGDLHLETTRQSYYYTALSSLAFYKTFEKILSRFYVYVAPIF